METVFVESDCLLFTGFCVCVCLLQRQAKTKAKVLYSYPSRVLRLVTCC